MSFWRTFGFHTVSAVDTLLDSGEYTLEQLLDEEEILQETKSQNKKLIEFLVGEPQLKQLLEYITVSKIEDEDHKRRYKYPYIACEIMSSEVWAICDAFFEHPVLLDILYGWLDIDDHPDPLVLTYCCRVAAVLLSKKAPESIAYLKNRKNCIENFVKHLANGNVMDLMLKVIASDDPISDVPVGTLNWLCTTDLMESLVAKLNPKNGEEVVENAAQALIDIISVSENQKDSPLVGKLESEKTVAQILDYLFSGGVNPSLLHGLSVLIELINRHACQELDQRTPDKLPQLIALLVQNLDKFISLLRREDKSNEPRYSSTIGSVPQLGFHRLKAVEFFVALALCKFKCVHDELIKKDVFNLMLDLFFDFPWNNFLHKVIVDMMDGIFLDSNDVLIAHIVKDARLLDRIVKANNDNQIQLNTHKGARLGNMGHISKLTVLVNNVKNEEIIKYIEGEREWQKYLATGFKENQKRDNTVVGEGKPVNFLDDDEDELVVNDTKKEEDNLMHEENTTATEEPEKKTEEVKEEVKSEEVKEETKSDAI